MYGFLQSTIVGIVGCLLCSFLATYFYSWILKSKPITKLIHQVCGSAMQRHYEEISSQIPNLGVLNIAMTLEKCLKLEHLAHMGFTVIQSLTFKILDMFVMNMNKITKLFAFNNSLKAMKYL